MRRRLTVAALFGLLLGLAFYGMPAWAQSIFVGRLPTNCTAAQIPVSAGTNLWTCGSGGSAAAAGSNTQVQFNDSGVFGADAGLTYVKASDILTVTGGIVDSALTATRVLFAGTAGVLTDDSGLTFVAATNQLTLSGDAIDVSFLLRKLNATSDDWAPVFQPYIEMYPGATPTGRKGIEGYLVVQPSADQTDFDNIYFSYMQIETYNAFDLYTYVVNNSTYIGRTTTGSTTTAAIAYQATVVNDETGTMTQAIGHSASIGNDGMGTLSSGYAYYGYQPSNQGTFTNYYHYYGADIDATITNPYFLWYDGGPGADCNQNGVFRVNDFGILAYYNPCFAKYTPGATDFERLIVRWGDTGVFGTDNEAYLGVEEGGTGVMRPLVIMGSSVRSEDDAAAAVTFEASKYLTDANCADSAGDAACGAAPSGSVVVDAADTATVVSTTAVTANSQIILQVDSSLGTRLSVTCNTQDPGTFDARITARTGGSAFTITVDTGPTTNPLCLNYWIVN